LVLVEVVMLVLPVVVVHVLLLQDVVVQGLLEVVVHVHGAGDGRAGFT